MADVSKKPKTKFIFSLIILGITLYFFFLPGCALPDMQEFSDDGQKTAGAESTIPSNTSPKPGIYCLPQIG